MNRFNTVFLLAAFAAIASSTVPARAAQLVGIDYDSGSLYSVSTVNASLTLIGNTGLQFVGEIEAAPNGTLYGFTSGTASNLYTINPQTAASSLVGPLGLSSVFEGGLAFAPNGTAYAANGNQAAVPQLFNINLNTGNATVIGTISGGLHDINGLAYRSDGELIGLDRVTNSLLLIDPTTAASSLLATITPTVGNVGGMTVLNGVGYFSTAIAGGGSNSMYSFDLFTGSTSFVGSFPPTITGIGISGIAAVPEPATFVLGIAGLAGLGLFAVARRRSA